MTASPVLIFHIMISELFRRKDLDPEIFRLSGCQISVKIFAKSERSFC